MPVSPPRPGSKFPVALSALLRCHSGQLLPGEGFTLWLQCIFLHLQGGKLRNTTETFPPESQTACKQGVNADELNTNRRPDITCTDEFSDRGWG